MDTPTTRVVLDILSSQPIEIKKAINLVRSEARDFEDRYTMPSMNPEKLVSATDTTKYIICQRDWKLWHRHSLN
jgi:hypothetical protein